MNYDVNKNGYWFSKEQLTEHDAKVRADAIDKCIQIAKTHRHIFVTPVLFEHFILELEELKENYGAK